MPALECTCGKQEESLLASVVLDIGEILLTAGAEVNRVEDTIRRIGFAYGFGRVEVFSITSFLVMTVHTGGGHIITQTRRIKATNVDLERVARANALSREICKKPLPLDELKLRVYDIMYHTNHYSLSVKFFAYFIVASSFTVFFGGSIMDALAASITSIVLCAAVTVGDKIRIQPFIQTMVCSFVLSLTCYGMVMLGIGQSFDKIVIGNIMLLIPGINLMTAVRDMVMGDIVTGLMGMCDALLKAFSISLGCAATILLTGIM